MFELVLFWLTGAFACLFSLASLAMVFRKETYKSKKDFGTLLFVWFLIFVLVANMS